MIDPLQLTVVSAGTVTVEVDTETITVAPDVPEVIHLRTYPDTTEPAGPLPPVPLSITGTAPNGTITVPDDGATYFVSPGQLFSGDFTAIEVVLPVPTSTSAPFRLIASTVNGLYTWVYPDDSPAGLLPLDGSDPFSTAGSSPVFAVVEFIPARPDPSGPWVWAVATDSSTTGELWEAIGDVEVAVEAAATAADEAMNAPVPLQRVEPLVAALHNGSSDHGGPDDGVVDIMEPHPDGLVGGPGTYEGLPVMVPTAALFGGWAYPSDIQSVVYVTGQTDPDHNGVWEFFHELEIDGVMTEIGPYFIRTVIWNGTFYDEDVEPPSTRLAYTRVPSGTGFSIGVGTHAGERWKVQGNGLKAPAEPQRIAATEVTGLDAEVASVVDDAVTAAVAGLDFQPLDTDLSDIAALSTTSYGRALLALADAAAGRTAFGLGAAAQRAIGTAAGQLRDAADPAYADTRTPTDGSVTAAKIPDGTITAAKLAVPGWQVIHDRTLSTASASETFTLTGHTLIRVRILSRVTTTASASIVLRATLNGDTGSNYSTAGGAATTFLTLGAIPGSNTNSDRPSHVDLELAARTGTWTVGRVINTSVASNASVAPGSAATSPLAWLSSSAWSSLELMPASSTFVAGSRFVVEALV